MKFVSIIFVIWFFVLPSNYSAASEEKEEGEISDCLKVCLQPVAKLHLSNSDIYLKYDEICEKLEPAAECARKCSSVAHAQFHQLTTNFRLHCLEFEEELEDHLPCLKKNTVKVEKKCNDLCEGEEDVVVLDKQKATCKQNECNMMCHLKGLAHHCPKSEKVQKKITIQKARELEKLRHHKQFGLLPLECQQLHDHKHVERILDDL